MGASQIATQLTHIASSVSCLGPDLDEFLLSASSLHATPWCHALSLLAVESRCVFTFCLGGIAFKALVTLREEQTLFVSSWPRVIFFAPIFTLLEAQIGLELG